MAPPPSLRQVAAEVEELRADLDQLQAISEQLDRCLGQLDEVRQSVRRLSNLGGTPDGYTLTGNIGIIRTILEREFGRP